MHIHEKKEYKKKFKIHEVAHLLRIKKSTIRQWEKEFNLPTATNNTYTEGDINLFKKIKKLLHEESLSAQDIKKELEEEREISTSVQAPVQIPTQTSSSEQTPESPSFTPAQSSSEEIPCQQDSKELIQELKNALITLKKQLSS